MQAWLDSDFLKSNFFSKFCFCDKVKGEEKKTEGELEALKNTGLDRVHHSSVHDIAESKIVSHLGKNLVSKVRLTRVPILALPFSIRVSLSNLNNSVEDLMSEDAWLSHQRGRKI